MTTPNTFTMPWEFGDGSWGYVDLPDDLVPLDLRDTLGDDWAPLFLHGKRLYIRRVKALVNACHDSAPKRSDALSINYFLAMVILALAIGFAPGRL